ncbi:MAG: hypothetical protein M3132_00960 [Actinomycetia bacterium]|nr:hypothetical protein [Actinomycetes bacterium]
MTGSRWVGISVGTLISALAFWFAVLAIPSNVVVGVSMYGAAIAFAMYGLAGFSGANDPMGSGFAAAIIALVTGGTLAVMFEATGFRPLIVTAPILAVGLGGTRALAPTKDKLRNSSRIAVLAGVTVGLNVVFTIEPTAFGLIAPLVPLPALGIADRFYERGKEVVDEGTP